jgi:hypothetical protein
MKGWKVGTNRQSRRPNLASSFWPSTLVLRYSIALCLLQEATAEEIWENMVHIHAVPVPEAFVVAGETLEVVEVVSFVDALVVS